MTVLVGIICKDGVVVGADGASTFVAGTRSPTIEQPTSKIHIIDNKIIVAGTGEVGLGQRFEHVMVEAWKNGIFKKPAIDAVIEVSRNALINFDRTFVRVPNINFGAMVAFPCLKQLQLCEFQGNNFQPELKVHDNIWFVTMGSGQPIADPFLALMRSVFWGDELPNHQDAIFAVTWALTHAVECNPGGIGEPIQIAVLTPDSGSHKARLLTEGELAEHRQNVEGAKAHLRDYRNQFSSRGVGEIPQPPQAPIDK